MSNDLAVGHVIKIRAKKTYTKKFTVKSYKDHYFVTNNLFSLNSPMRSTLSFFTAPSRKVKQNGKGMLEKRTLTSVS